MDRKEMRKKIMDVLRRDLLIRDCWCADGTPLPEIGGIEEAVDAICALFPPDLSTFETAEKCPRDLTREEEWEKAVEWSKLCERHCEICRSTLTPYITCRSCDWDKALTIYGVPIRRKVKL